MALGCADCGLQFNNVQDLESHAVPCRPGSVLVAAAAGGLSVSGGQDEDVEPEPPSVRVDAAR